MNFANTASPARESPRVFHLMNTLVFKVMGKMFALCSIDNFKGFAI